MTGSRCPLFVELCAGTAAVSLSLHGGRKARPPVSRMGSKRGYASAILGACGLYPGERAEHYLWCEPDPGVRLLLEAYRDPDLAREAAAIIRSWADEDPRALWDRLRAEGPPRGPEPREVARWVWWYGRSFNGTGTAFRPDQSSTGTPVWNAHPPEHYADETRRATGLPATITDDARPIEPADLPPGTVVYIDPPYVGTTKYADDLPRSEVVAMARRWADAGALVVISEQAPLPALMADGWHSMRLTSARRGQRRTFSKQQEEWLTISAPPVVRPLVQQGLFA